VSLLARVNLSLAVVFVLGRRHSGVVSRTACFRQQTLEVAQSGAALIASAAANPRLHARRDRAALVSPTRRPLLRRCPRPNSVAAIADLAAFHHPVHFVYPRVLR